MANPERGAESFIELLIMPAVILLEAFDVGGSEQAGKVRDGFAGMTELLALIALPAMLLFMELGEAHHEKK